MSMIDEYNAFKKDPANYVPLSPLSFIERTAGLFPNRVSVIHGNHSYTYAETFTRCRRLASALQKLGVGAGVTVAVMAFNTPEMVECHSGVAASGGVLNAINVRLDPDTIAYILTHGEAKILITDTAFAASVSSALAILAQNNDGGHGITIIDIEDAMNDGDKTRLGVISYEDLLASGDPDFNWQLPDDEWDAMALNYTSGSTGRPKGVVYHHRGSHLMTMGTIADWQMPQHLCYYYVVPLFHCNGWGHVWAVTAMAGTIVCSRGVTAKTVYAAIADHGITHFAGAPIVLGMIVNAIDSDRQPFDHTVEVLTAGAPPPAVILESIEKIGFNITQAYGLTETYGHSVICAWNSDWDGVDIAARATLKARQGVAMSLTQSIVVIDGDSGKHVPWDGATIGEIGIQSNTIMKGYLKNPDATRAAFENGYFKSGDLAVMHPDGYIEIKDRLKDIIISGGENISSVEIESALHRHPAVAIAAVVAKSDDKWGEVPCAFVELKPETAVTEEALIDFTRAHLAGYKRPKQIIFMTIPKTATGKLQKFELRNMVKQGKV